jgi:hypothetical protein
MSPVVDYCVDERPRQSSILVAIVALFGVTSGPIAFGLGCIIDRGFPQLDDPYIYLVCGAVHVGAVAFAIVVGYSFVLVPRDRILIAVGVIAPVLWGLMFVVLLAHAISQLE